VAGAMEESARTAGEALSNEPTGYVRRMYRWINESICDKMEAMRQK
jgi:hypothetical protein